MIVSLFIIGLVASNQWVFVVAAIPFFAIIIPVAGLLFILLQEHRVTKDIMAQKVFVGSVNLKA